MINIIFFLGSRQLEPSSIQEVQDREQYTFILIVNEVELKNLNKHFLNSFDYIHTIPQESKDLFSGYNYDDAFAVMKKYLQHTRTHTQAVIICNDEFNVVLAAKLRSVFNISQGIQYEEIQKFRDKLLMKKTVEAKNIAIPQYLKINSETKFSDVQSQLGLPFIAKPVSSAGSFGVVKIKNESDFQKLIGDLKNTDQIFEAEEFIDGELFHCDSVLKNGNILFMEVCLNICPNLDFQHGKALGSFILLKENPLRQKILSFSEQILAAFGLPDGIYHIEIFKRTNNELVFLEVGARAPGLSIPLIYKKTFNQNPVDLEISALTGIKFLETTVDIIPSFFAFFPIEEGIVKDLIPPDITSDYSLDWKVHVGEFTKKSSSNLDIGAIIIVSNKNYPILENDFNIISKHKAIIY